MPTLLVRALLLTSALIVAGAKAEGPAEGDAAAKRLTDRGRIMVGGQIAGGWSNDDREGWGAYNRWWVSVQPSVTYFVRDRVGLGVWAGGGTGSGRTARVYDASFGLQGLFDVRLGPRVSMFVQPFAGFTWQVTKYFGQLPSTTGDLIFDDIRIERQFVRLGTDPPLVFHLSESVAIGFGPEFTMDLFAKEDTTADAVTGASGYGYPRGWRVITGLGSFIGASF